MENNQRKSSDARIRASMKYRQKTYKRLAIDYKPEQIEDIKAVAASEGLSMAAYIWQLHIAHKEKKEGQAG